MAEVSKGLNAGVHNATGIEFQKHCALFLLLEGYESLKGKKYFICIEHQDDFLFCLQNDIGELTSVEAFQAKKSSNKWSITDELCDILKKLVEVGVALKEDTIQKDKTYSHTLHFITNNSIALKAGSKPKFVTATINESNSRVEYLKLDKEIKDCLKEKVEAKLGSNVAAFKEIDNMIFGFIDLGRTRKSQIDQLIGKFTRIFGDKVNDPNAAVLTLLELFREIETAFNQGFKASLLDKKKRIECNTINQALDIITSQQMAFKVWRSFEKGIAKALGISLKHQKEFEYHFNNSFDLFKDLHQVEHQKILSFVYSNEALLENHSEEATFVIELLDMFKSQYNSQLSELEVKAAIFAASIELINSHE
ncbi:dsDNA nuclease domain-containing protein [Pontibacter pudoricolor]|uniref:dsDNA nuclease domain-containing protein n=1 Tax=Pontibacter pudoricolor TaxID=2694930 RepID=UPI001391E1B1|nr:dsDNA nuclease domain-containing protein [Pontibacter pudoricolor]